MNNDDTQHDVVDDDAPGVSEGAEENAHLFALFESFDKDLEAHWEEWRPEARECYAFYSGEQWDQDDIAAAEETQRLLVQFNRIAPTVDAVIGAEITGRQQVQFLPREVGDSAVNEILTQGANWILDECDGESEDTDAFRDCLICGIGWSEQRPDYEVESVIIRERVDPLEMAVDPSSRKSNFADATYIRRERKMSKRAFEELAASFGKPDATPDEDSLEPRKPVIVDPRLRYTGVNPPEGANEDEVTVREYQWVEKTYQYLVLVENQIVSLSQEQFEEVEEEVGIIEHQRVPQKRYRKAIVAGSDILELTDIELGDFTYTAITGKRDRNKNYWYGLVKPMLDPQRFSNKFLSQIINIINTNAKGGLMAEEDAFVDQREAEDSWASYDEITWLKSGAMTGANGSKIQIKPSPVYPQGSDRLMTLSNEAIRDVTGVNQELLGLADRQQPGVLEFQRKQSAYGILASFFDSKRRYTKMAGKKLLAMMRLYLPQDKLVRVTGEDNQPRYVPLALAPQTAEYDVVVDEAPSAPNQKMQTFQIMTQMMPVLEPLFMQNPQLAAEFIRYSPLPTALAEKTAQALSEMQQAQATAQQQQQAKADAMLQAEIGEKNAGAAQRMASAEKDQAQIEYDGIELLGKAAAMLNPMTPESEPLPNV